MFNRLLIILYRYRLIKVAKMNKVYVFLIVLLMMSGCSRDEGSNTVTVVTKDVPVRSEGKPNATLAEGTTEVEISLKTVDAATCRYSTTLDESYDQMSETFSTTGSRTHSQLITGLMDQTLYKYYVRCKDSEGEMNSDDFLIFFSVGLLTDETVPTLPGEFNATAMSSSEVALSWTPSQDNVGVVGYRLYRCLGSGCTPTVDIATVLTPFYLDTGLSTLSTYRYSVAAFDSNANSSGVATVEVTTLNQADMTKPVAVDDNITSLINQAVVFSVTDNDIDSNLDVGSVDLNLTMAGIQSTYIDSDDNSWSVNALGDVTFTPALNFNTMATISYVVHDTDGQASEPANLNITVIPEVVATALYVSVSDAHAVDDGNCGLGPYSTAPQNYPCRSIMYTLTNRVGSTGRSQLFIANGHYIESVVLRDGIDLFGGFNAATWEQDVASTQTILTGNSSGVSDTVVITAEALSSPTRVEGLVIQGESNYEAGGNSYGIWVRDSGSNLQIRHNTIMAGRGADAMTGSNGPDGSDGDDGVAGEVEIDPQTASLSTCTNRAYTPGNQGVPGNGGLNAPMDGGSGAGAVCPNDNDAQPSGSDGSVAVGGGAAGTGGVGGHDYQTNSGCSYDTAGYTTNALAGSDGADGSDGSSGVGCSGTAGDVISGHWRGDSGTSGHQGTAGGGGGGGGAGGGIDDNDGCGLGDALGNSGGGGGAGGAGGHGGQGGQSGGGSFGIFVTFSMASDDYPIIEENTIVRGSGGNGGDGGFGGVAGVGGIGGAGGDEHLVNVLSGKGGDGGKGGSGGHGGGGGGGCGGVAYGVYIFNNNSVPTYDTSNSFSSTGAVAAAGGRGGLSYGNSGTDGHDGVVGDVNY